MHKCFICGKVIDKKEPAFKGEDLQAHAKCEKTAREDMRAAKIWDYVGRLGEF